MRHLMRSTLFAAALIVGWSANLHAEEPPDSEIADSDDESSAGSTSDPSTEERPDTDSSAGYRYAVGVLPALLLRETAYRARESVFMLRAAGRRRLVGPLFASLGLEYSRRAPDAGELVVANTHAALVAGAGAEAWIESLRFSAQAQAGPLVRHLKLADRRGTQHTSTRWEPTFGGQISIGSSFFDSLLVALDGGVRFFAPKRTDLYMGIQVGWLFAPIR